MSLFLELLLSRGEEWARVYDAGHEIFVNQVASAFRIIRL